MTPHASSSAAGGDGRGEGSPVLLERRGRVAIVTLNRPAKLNAMSTQMMAELGEIIIGLDGDPDVGCIVITGAGDRAFSAGRDLAEEAGERSSRAGGSEPVPAEPSSQGSRGYAAVSGCRKPVLAAIRGYAYGGGAILALGCDVRIAAEDARFKFPGAAYGLPAGGVQLAQVVGPAKSKELLFTGDVVDAREALRIGLVNQVVPASELQEYTLSMAERIAVNSPAALEALKAIANLMPAPDQALERQRQADRELRSSADATTRLSAAAERVTGANRR
ncbi:MAG TPA: enoyl-CoA hydratase/isomerase family protein [Chloroflexota bacterium]|nr:enoyl-CoA hydratase/isomerase family protein [Chloroflexota bacterium]